MYLYRNETPTNLKNKDFVDLPLQCKCTSSIYYTSRLKLHYTYNNQKLSLYKYDEVKRLNHVHAKVSIRCFYNVQKQMHLYIFDVLEITNRLATEHLEGHKTNFFVCI